VNRFVLACPEPPLYAAASGIDPSSQAILDPRFPKPWCETWQAVVNMRHLLFFVASRPHLFKVVLVGRATIAATGSDAAGEGSAPSDPRKGLHAGVSTGTADAGTVGDGAREAAFTDVVAADVAALTVEELLRCCVSYVGPAIEKNGDGKETTGRSNHAEPTPVEMENAETAIATTTTESDPESGWWLEVLQGQWARTEASVGVNVPNSMQGDLDEKKQTPRDGEMFLRVTATNQWNIQWLGDA